jgi:hypothetical protein
LRIISLDLGPELLSTPKILPLAEDGIGKSLTSFPSSDTLDLLLVQKEIFIPAGFFVWGSSIMKMPSVYRIVSLRPAEKRRSKISYSSCSTLP